MKYFWRILVILVLVFSFHSFWNTKEKILKEETPSFEKTKVSVQPSPSPLDNTDEPPHPIKPEEDTALQLNAGNFESLIQECYQGQACNLQEDPWELYKRLQQQRKLKAIDSLFSFLRSRLKNSAEKIRYKNVLKRMIDDFYPPEEKEFQQAAYYNYLGDLQKSLDLYLDLEKRQATDPTLKPAPKLNIANTLYDMGRYQEALPYYQAALQEYQTGQAQSGTPTTSDMIVFIQNRIININHRAEMKNG